MVKLFCAVVGAAGSAFSVQVDEGDSVDGLKDAIAEKQKYDFAASKLQLYLAKKDDAWLTENDVKLVSGTNGLKHLDVARAKLHLVGLSNEKVGEVDEVEEAAGNGPVNVLVVVPTEQHAASDQFPALVPTKKRRVNLRIAYAGPLHLDEFSVPMETIAAFNDIQAGFSREGSRGRPLCLLYGPRQFGKSTIAYRIADWMAADPHMADPRPSSPRRCHVLDFFGHARRV